MNRAHRRTGFVIGLALGLVMAASLAMAQEGAPDSSEEDTGPPPFQEGRFPPGNPSELPQLGTDEGETGPPPFLAYPIGLLAHQDPHHGPGWKTVIRRRCSPTPTGFVGRRDLHRGPGWRMATCHRCSDTRAGAPEWAALHGQAWMTQRMGPDSSAPEMGVGGRIRPPTRVRDVRNARRVAGASQILTGLK